MHLNHFFLKQLAGRLKDVLAGARLEEAFSQERDELVLLFRLKGEGEEWHIRAFMRAELTYLSFPTSFNRARANTASLFERRMGWRCWGFMPCRMTAAFGWSCRTGMASFSNCMATGPTWRCCKGMRWLSFSSKDRRRIRH